LTSTRWALEDPAWPAALAGLRGYMPARSGQVLSLTQVLRWWNFRVAMPAVAGSGSGAVLADAVLADQSGSTA